MKIYTRTGDRGETSLFGGTRVPKNDPRIDAYGTVDELNSLVGLARASWPSSPVDSELLDIQRDLFDVGAFLAAPGGRFESVADGRILDLEKSIDAMEGELPALTSFILPGGALAAAHLHVARTVCRRAERLAVALGDDTGAMSKTVAYLNRLSDYLFVAARFANLKSGGSDVVWKR